MLFIRLFFGIIATTVIFNRMTQLNNNEVYYLDVVAAIIIGFAICLLDFKKLKATL